MQVCCTCVARVLHTQGMRVTHNMCTCAWHASVFVDEQCIRHLLTLTEEFPLMALCDYCESGGDIYQSADTVKKLQALVLQFITKPIFKIFLL